ncbi:MAG: MerR family transcriptional regulator [Planctomycetota bacterium]
MSKETGSLIQPLYSIAVASELTKVSPVMIREYEKAGFLKPIRVHSKRRFSRADIGNIGLLRYYLQDRKMTLNGLKVLLEETPCYQIKGCKQNGCTIFGKKILDCWKVAQSAKGCDSSLCPTCPIRLIRSRKSPNLPMPEDIPRITDAP